MEPAELLKILRAKVSAQVDLVPEGLGRYRVLTPFQFDDGDHWVVVLRRDGAAWQLSEEGHTFMHLTYSIDDADLHRGPRQRIIDAALAGFFIEDRAGELVLPVPGDQYGDALFSFAQGLLRISDVSYLSREHARSTFLQDLRSLLSEAIPSDRLTFDWHDPRDPQGKYVADARIDRAEGAPKTVLRWRTTIAYGMPPLHCCNSRNGGSHIKRSPSSRTRNPSTERSWPGSATSATSSSPACCQTATAFPATFQPSILSIKSGVSR